MSTSPDAVIAALTNAVDVRGSRDPRQLLVYIHIPFCSSKCSFCHWVSGIPVRQLRAGSSVRQLYVDAVKEQIRYYGPRLMDLGYSPRYVYWGGGTPSILSPDEIAQLGEALRENLDLADVEEFTFEASPETLTLEKLEAFRAAGFERMSIGVQSFDEAELRRAGRAHTASQAVEAFKLARRAGFRNLNIDLIAGFPGQTDEMVDLSIEKCCRLGPEHVTLYIYSDFAPTVMARQSKAGIRPRSTYRERVSLYDKGREKLCKHGYEEYMPCYFSRRPRWRFGSEMYYFGLLGDHFGFGSGANSSIAKHFLGNQRGNMKRFILEPREFDFVVRYQPDERSLDIILTRMPFSTCMAVDYHEFADRFGFEFREVVDHPRIVQWRETVALQRRVGVHESERGIEIDRFYAAELVDSSKREFRTRQDASV